MLELGKLINLNDPIVRMALFAHIIHFKQTRKNKAKTPAIAHMERVAKLVEESGGTEVEIVAAWGHDGDEDTPANGELFEFLFGQEVAAVIDGLTDPPEFEGLPISERKVQQALRVRIKSVSVKRVKLADQIDNVRSVAFDPPVGWTKEKCLAYVQGAALIANECAGISVFLDEEFAKAYAAAMRAIAKMEGE